MATMGTSAQLMGSPHSQPARADRGSMTRNFLGKYQGARHDAERGAVMFLLVAAIMVVLLGGALAVDLSIVSTRGQQLQNAADASALAGVQAYRQSDGNRAAAEAAVAELLSQNGIAVDGTTTFAVTFPEGVSDTEVIVTVSDSDPGTLLTGVTGVTSGVSRSATARFDSCQANCTVSVVIPSPFRSVDAAGQGDGYKPISVGNELYALNHNSSYGGIVCIDRDTANDPDIQGICDNWSDTSRRAYPGTSNTQRNPEMPHVAVSGTKIYWAGSDSAGTKLYCFETSVATPCSSSVLINNRSRASSSDISNQKDRNRGGGTVLAGGRIFVFTDDFRVHCFNPGTPATRCSDYGSNGEASFLANDNFPENEPRDGNHGSSIDRIVDDINGKIYWTIHVPTGPAPPADCSSDNLEFPEGLVSIQNAWSRLFLEADSSGNGTGNNPNNDEVSTHWTVEPQSDGRYAFRSVSRGRVLDSDSGNDSPLETSSSVRDDDRWTINWQITTSTIYSSNDDSYAYDNGTDFATHEDLNGQASDWIIQHPACSDPGYTPGPATAVEHTGGTWLQCWDFVNNQSCSNFTPSAIHTDGSRFSGRLFFYMSNASIPTVQGVCSSGFAGSVRPSDFEINCVNNNSGAYDANLTLDLGSLRSAIAGVTDSSPAAWGDPHYNPDSNRLFYPTAHDESRVVCWDFDFGMCGVLEQISSLGPIEDYGYFSEGDCVYGLGHNAFFYAFQAEDIGSECTGSSTSTRITPCDCSGDWEWGTITFDVDLALFDEFFIQVLNSSGDLVYPPPDPSIPGDNPQHSLHVNGATVDLNGLPVSTDPENDFLEILVTVNAENDPWAEGEQTFSVEFARAPRLTD